MEHCKRYDCLYHPQKKIANNCDYILVAGIKRGCIPGEGCERYIKSTPEERTAINSRKYDDLLFWLIAGEEGYAHY